MKKIIDLIDQPAALEKYYRENKNKFIQDFHAAYPELEGNPIATTWKARLDYTKNSFNWGDTHQIKTIILLALLGGIFAKLPFFLNIQEDLYYQKNIGVLLFGLPAIYILATQKTNYTVRWIFSIFTLAGILFINGISFSTDSDIFQLSALHLTALMASLLGMVWLKDLKASQKSKVAMLKFGADLIIICGLLMLSFGILSAITLGMFEAIGWSIETFWSSQVLPWLGPSIPLLGTFILMNNQGLVQSITPLIAKVFSPLVTIVLLAFIIIYTVSEQNAFENRDTLIIFNVLLLGVMAIFFFSLINLNNGSQPQKLMVINLLAMSILTFTVNLIALSSIIMRLNEFGLTPNRLVVLGSNLLILFNLMIGIYPLAQVLNKKSDAREVPERMVAFLPVYMIWFLLVVFIFPLLFGIY
jgi:hypothetical protein